MNERSFKVLGIILGSLLLLAYIISVVVKDDVSLQVFNIIYSADLALGLVFLFPYAIKRAKKLTLAEWLIILFLIAFYGVMIYKNTIF